ncbi:MAG: alpha/beta hydrolase [Mucilaginibacter polytrichastri]|nr:alpha/beta hydrolase [Mucilaginibacter polytrichastri]
MKKSIPAKSGFAPVNGLNMYYEIHGSGAPLVIIHGGGSSIDVTFGRILPFLARYFRVIGMDLQGHGRTNARGTTSTFSADADDVFALMQHLDMQRAHIFGFSNGANTAMELAVRHPEVIDRLILSANFCRKDGAVAGFWDGMQGASIEMMPLPLKEAYLGLGNTEEDLLRMFNLDYQRMMNFPDWSDDDLKKLRAKTLVLSSFADVVSPEHALHMSRTIPDAELVILRGYHGEFLGELITGNDESRMPEAATEIVREFLNGK